MSDYTLRNKNTNPVLTLRPKMMDKLLAARPESSALALAKTADDLKTLLGRRPTIDFEQSSLLAMRAEAVTGDRGSLMWRSRYDSSLPPTLSKIKALFEVGYMHRTTSDLQADLELAEQFFDMLDDAIAKSAGQTRAPAPG